MTVGRAKGLAQDLPPPSQVSIERCGLVTPCRQRWDALEALKDQPDVRFCGQCQRAVFLARDDIEFDSHAVLGRCIAVLQGPTFIVGGTGPAYSLEAE